jgi:hypothetical protein
MHACTLACDLILWRRTLRTRSRRAGAKDKLLHILISVYRFGQGPTFVHVV